MPEKVAIVGSRDPNNAARRRAVEQAIDALQPGTVVITGDATGVDRWARNHADYRGHIVVVCQAPWRALGKKAGPIRNGVIAVICDRMLAFPNHAEPYPGSGTWGAIELVRAAGKTADVRHVPAEGK